MKEPCSTYRTRVGHKPSAFGVHEGGMLLVTAFFDRREHFSLGGKHVHKKMSVGDDHPKNLVLIIVH